MRVRILFFSTLFLAALGLVMGGGHVLELVPKMHYSERLYKEVNSTLYQYYAMAGGTIQVLSLIAAAVLTFSLRGWPAFRPTLAAWLCLAASLGLWFALVQPVNSEWTRLLQAAPEGIVLESYARLRPRWEWGHFVAFVAWLVGVSLLIFSVVFRRPTDRQADSGLTGLS